MEKHLNITEIFYSLQGESSYAGYPCVFIRLAECNLRCSYCDTQYAFGKGRSMAISAILEEVQDYGCSLVEITGGEPLYQDDVLTLGEELLRQTLTVLLETNGSLYLGDVPQEIIKIVDVKTPGSGMGSSFMKGNLKFLQPHDELKSVITNYLDYRFALDFLQTNHPQVAQIHFSPVSSVLDPSLLAAWMLEDRVQARLSLQLHRSLAIR